eukprot:TRINITY_DN31853_c0_g2_i1.p1 TRINITY_DN31853_c0_g2~~TRINITY_DN31853_c0_g2_i1.p1  ORF type:complete len:467 (-),score=11.64 TRINITY_DN31853_c0_g2_i1:363-1640(-)
MSTLDDFLSHDWSQPRWKKMLALYTMYNRRIAVMVSSALALPLAYIGAGTHMPMIRGDVAVLVCPIIYFSVLIFGQRLSDLLRRPRYAFLDKLCIHQTDEQKKSAGILALAGFLRASRRLVVLWSPGYFSRLWCTYEVVTWVHLNGLDEDKVRFLPSAACIIQTQLIMAISAYKMMRVLIDRIEFFGQEDWTVVAVRVFLVLFVVPIAYTITSLIVELRMVKDQVKNFRIRDSKCFCCTHRHKHPDGGTRIPCDRELVYATLRRWQRPSLHEDSDAAALDAFDAQVRYGLCQMLSRSLNKYGYSYKDCAHSCLAAVWGGCDAVAVCMVEGRYLHAVRWLLEYSTLPLFVAPLAFATALNSFIWMDSVVSSISSKRCRNVGPAVFSAIVLFVPFLVLWIPGPSIVDLSQDETVGILDVVLVVRYIG